MGMDIVGRAPLSKKGEYFRANVWWWHPLAEYCEEVAPKVWSKIEHAHSNDGDGLDSEDAVELATRLQESVDSGYAQKYVRAFNAKKTGNKDDVKNWPSIDTKTIRDFISFLKTCGGFNIY